MKKKFTKEWIKAAGIRALKTMIQAAVSVLTVGTAIQDIQWEYVLSVALVAGLASLLTSVGTTLPELSTDGTLLIDETGEKDTYRFEFDQALPELKTKKTVTFVVDPTAIIPSSPQCEVVQEPPQG